MTKTQKWLMAAVIFAAFVIGVASDRFIVRADGYVHVDRWGGPWNVTHYPIRFSYHGVTYDCVPRENPTYLPHHARLLRGLEGESEDVQGSYHRDRIYELRGKIEDHEKEVTKICDKHNAIYEMIQKTREMRAADKESP